MWSTPQEKLEIAIGSLLRSRMSGWEALKYDLATSFNDGGRIFAIFLGLLGGLALSSSAFAFANGLDVLPLVAPRRLPDVRSVLLVLTIVQSVAVFSLAYVLPSRHEAENPSNPETRACYRSLASFYLRMPLEPPGALRELCRCTVGKNLILGAIVALITCYVHLLVVYQRGWGWEPILGGTVAGVVQYLVNWHLFCATWMFASPVNVSFASRLANAARWSILSWPVVLVSVLYMPGPLPKLIVDPNDPQAIFGAFSGYLCFWFQMFIPTGWVNRIVEMTLMPPRSWGLLAVVPVAGLLILHWRKGPYYWYQLTLDPQPNPTAIPLDERQPATSEVTSELEGSWQSLNMLSTSERPTAKVRNLRLESQVSLPSAGGTCFSEQTTGAAERVFFPSIPHSLRSNSSWALDDRRWRQVAWCFAVLVVLALLGLARVRNVPQYDLLIVVGVIGLHACSILSPNWDRWGTSQQWLPLVMNLPVHADWLWAWWLRRSMAWCGSWLVLLSLTWLPLLQWFDRLSLFASWQKLFVVFLAMNVGVAAVACVRSLPWWNELNARLRGGFFDLSFCSLGREFFVSFGYFGWATLHLTLPVTLTQPSSVFLGHLGLCLGWSWGLLFLVRRWLLYPAQETA
jgi:hypothetical protein